MSSIKGSSIIGGFSGSAQGIIGPTGPSGPRGATGPSGITIGPTGATAVYINRVVSYQDTNTINFYTSDGNLFSLSGFTGGGIGNTYYSSGISAGYSSDYYTPFFGVSGGLTFVFLGISAGNNVTINKSANDTLVVTTNSIAGSYGLSLTDNYIPYTSGNTLLSTSIYSNTDNILNFGSTGTSLNTLFSSLNENIVLVPPVFNNDIGGITLDLRQSSNYWLETPIGITAFIPLQIAGIRQEYTLFINGSNVWNLPKNLYFENSDRGVAYKGFLDGVNIIHIWSDNAGATFNAAFIERGIGSNTETVYDTGSCCFERFGYTTCEDSVNKSYCDSRNGSFLPLISCSSRPLNCGEPRNQNIRGETGACCCGITGCLDSSNVDVQTGIITRDICENVIRGKFYPGRDCGYGDFYNQYSKRPLDGNTAANIICHSSCIDPVACCRIVDGIGVCTEETKWYCEQIGGNPLIGKTCKDVQILGGCADLLQEGYCIRRGQLLPTQVTREECIKCGYFCGITCSNVDLVIPENRIIITTLNPFIRIVHSVSIPDDLNLITTYSTRDVTKRYLSFQVVDETSQKYNLWGQVKFLDVSIQGQTTFDIWDLNNNDNTGRTCFEVRLYDQDGVTLSKNDFLIKNTNYYLELTARPSKCIDQDFFATLELGLNTCYNGFNESTLSEPVTIAYSRSPCRCLEFNSGSRFGDVVNKNPIIIPFTAERFSTVCGNTYISKEIPETHQEIKIPYPIKRQKGVITFCPPTESEIDVPYTVCNLPEAFCVYYGNIETVATCAADTFYNKINLDTNALFSIAQNYQINTEKLERNLIQIIQNKNNLFTLENVSDTAVGGTTFEETIKDITYNPDPDDQAKTSCINCKNFFDLDKKIQIPNTNDTFDVYGLVIHKMNMCDVIEPGVNRPKSYNEINTDIKYYIIIISSSGCNLVYDIGLQTIVSSPILDLDSDKRFFNGTSTCSLNCEDYTSYIKEAVWLGTVTPLALETGNCSDTKKLKYTIKKILDSNINSFEKEYNYNISDLIDFQGLNRSTDSINIKDILLANTLFKLINANEEYHISSTCSICSNDNCYSDIIKHLTEFVSSCSDLYIQKDQPLQTELKPIDNPNTIPYKVVENGVYTDVAVGSYFTALKTATAITGWGTTTPYGVLPTSDGIDVIKMSCSADTCCYLKSDGTVECKGINSNLFTGTFTDIAVGYAFSAGIQGGIFKVFGNNLPTVSPASKFKKFSLGKYHVCGISANDKIICFGLSSNNKFNQLNAPSVDTYTDISCGGYHCIALKTNRELSGWGITFAGLHTVPAGTYKKISAGYLHNCVIKDDNTIVCWGHNAEGQCNAPNGQYSNVFCGREHTVALDLSGGLTCWGAKTSYGCGTFEGPTGIINLDKTYNILANPADFDGDIEINNLISLYDSWTGTPISNELYKNHIVGLLDIENNEITSKTYRIRHPENIFKFYWGWAPNKNTINHSTSYYPYDVYSNDQYFNSQHVILRQNVNKFDPDYFRKIISISDIETFNISEFDDDNDVIKYTPKIKFKLKYINNLSTSDIKYFILKIENNEIKSEIPFENFEINGNNVEIRKSVFGDPYDFSNKWLLITTNYSPSYLTKYQQDYLTNGITGEKNYFNNGLFYGTSNLTTLNYFILKKLPIPSSEQPNPTIEYILENKLIAGNCVELDCTEITTFCNELTDC